MEDIEDSLKRIKESFTNLPESVLDDLKFEIDLFLGKVQLLHEKGTTGTLTVDLVRVKQNLYSYLRDDLIYFLQKLLTKAEYFKEGPLSRFHPRDKDIIFILKELQVHSFYPVARDFQRTSIVERWFGKLAKKDTLVDADLINYFQIFRYRMYSLTDDAPYGVSDLSRLLGDMLTAQQISFERIYSAEIALRQEILYTLLREVSPQSRIEYLVSKEIIEGLSDHFIAVLHEQMQASLKAALVELEAHHTTLLAEKRNLESEIKAAGKVQSKSLQKDLPVGDDRISFALYYDPLITIGGDYYHIDRVGDDEYTIFVADISGHGLGAALHLNTVRLGYEANKVHNDRPEKLLRRLNEDLFGKLGNDFVTAIHIHLNLKKKQLKYASAGHPLPCLLQETILGTRSRFLRSSGKILGAFPKAKYEEYIIPLSANDRLLVYTDGITEAMNLKGQMLTEKGLRKMLNVSLPKDTNQALHFIKSQVDEFIGPSEINEDDRTLLLIDIMTSDAKTA